MAQSDLTIQNQSFPSFRADLNDALTALNTTQSGTSRPTSAVAGTIWLDTTSATTPTLKLYDGTDDISLATLDYTANSVNWLDNSVSFDIVNDTTPQLGGQLDVNGNAIGNGTEELIKFVETASAVNEITVINADTTNAPEISATGDDTNIDLKITPKGIGLVTFNGGSKIQHIAEKATVSAVVATGTINYDVTTQAVLYYTSNASANWTLNIRGDGSNTLNSVMDTGEAITIVHLVTQGATAKYNSAVQIDGSSITPEWQGGSAPSQGNANSIDAYTYTIFKTADATFTALASQTQFA
jgi:hypothetical protein